MSDSTIFYIILVVLFLLFISTIYAIYIMWSKKSKLHDTRQTYMYKKNQQIIFNNITALTKCTDHLALTHLIMELSDALDYFEKNNLTMLDRPPEKIRASAMTYAGMLLEDIYRNSKKEVEVDFFDDAELESLEDYQAKNQEEKDEILKRRQRYKEKLKEKMHFDKLHNKKDIIDYLDEETAKKLQDMQNKKAMTPKMRLAS